MGFGGHRALEQSVEEQAPVARSPAVEAEGELVEVVVELGVADRALVGPEDRSCGRESAGTSSTA